MGIICKFYKLCNVLLYWYLSLRDLTALCDFFKLSVKEFVSKYCRWADYYYGTKVLALLEKKNYDCILWENGCSAYTARPIQCSTYPFWSWMIQDKETWEECAKDCPGMNKGKVWPVEEIEKNKRAYDANKPLKMEEVLEIIEKEDKEKENDKNKWIVNLVKLAM